jgi:hypothetical protein
MSQDTILTFNYAELKIGISDIILWSENQNIYA